MLRQAPAIFRQRQPLAADQKPGPLLWPLLALAALVMVLAAVGVLPRWPGLIHLVALPPLGLVADLRILFASAPSYPLFTVGLLLSLAVRITLLALLLGGLGRTRLRFALYFYLLALAPSALSASFLTMASAVTFYLLFWSGLAVAILTFAALGALPWTGSLRLRYALVLSLKHGLRLGTLLSYFGLFVVLGAIADLTKPVGAVLLVPVSAALTFGTARFLSADPGLRLPRRVLAAATIAPLIALAIIVINGPWAPPQDPPPLAGPRPGSLFIMSGVDSASGEGAIFAIGPTFLDFTCQQTFYYSYAGPGDGQPQRNAFCPIRTGAPYSEPHTLRPSEELAAAFIEQVDGLPEPVTVLAHSQAPWIVWAALAAGESWGIANVVLVGTLPASPVGYPQAGQLGPGKVSGDIARLLARFVARPGGTNVFRPDLPLAQEFLSDPTAIADLMERPLPGEVAVLSITSTFDLPMMPGGWRIEGAVDACPLPVIHPHLPWSLELLETTGRFLDGDQLPPCPVWRPAIGPLTHPFSPPPYDA